MKIRLTGSTEKGGLGRPQLALIAAVGVAGLVASVVLVASLVRGDHPKNAGGQAVSSDEAKLLVKSEEQRAKSAAQAQKLRQQEMGQGYQFDADGNLLGAPTDSGGDLPKNRHLDDDTGLGVVHGRLPPAAKAAYPASIAIARGIDSDELPGEGAGEPAHGVHGGGEPAESDDRGARAESMLGYSTVAGASWAGRRPQGDRGADRGPGTTGAVGPEGSGGRPEAAVDRMVKLVEESVRQGTEGQARGGEAEGGTAHGGAGAASGRYWGAGAQAGPSTAGETLYAADRRSPAEVKPQGMAAGGVGDMRIGGAVGPEMVVRQGKFLDCAIVNEIRADLVESPVIAMVARDFVSLDGKYVLVPAGSKLLGEAGRVQNLQQERVYIKFDRVIFPDQRSAYFPVRKVPGVDGMGAVGVAGEVDRHFMLQFGAAVMLGVLDGIGAAVQSPSAGANPTLRDLVAARTSSNFSTVLAGVIGRYANVVPTVTVPAGAKLKVFFSEDVRVSPYMASAELSWVGGSR